MNFFFSRDYIVDIIKKSKKTKDGYYFYPYFNSLNCLKGNNDDKKYYYNRYVFYNKIYFTEDDINMYLSVIDMDVDMYEYQRKIDKFYNIVKHIKVKDLFDKIDNYQYNMNDIIDNYEFIYEHK